MSSSLVILDYYMVSVYVLIGYGVSLVPDCSGEPWWVHPLLTLIVCIAALVWPITIAVLLTIRHYERKRSGISNA